MANESAPEIKHFSNWSIKSPYGEPPPDQPLIVAGDRLIGVHEKKTMYAFNIFTGEEINVKGGFPYTSPTGIETSPAVTAGRVFFIEGGHLHALNVTDGGQVRNWSAPKVDGVTSLAGVDDVVLALISTWGSTSIAAYRASDGKRPSEWQDVISATSYSAGCVGIGTDAIFYVSGNQLFSTNKRFGETRFPKDTTKPGLYPDLDQTRPPFVARSTVIAMGKSLYGFDSKTGVEKWKVDSDKNTASESSVWWATLSEDKSWAIAVNSHDELYLLDPDKGPVLKKDLPANAGGQPAIVGENIHVLAADRKSLTALHLDLARKQIIFTKKKETGADLSACGPTVGNGVLFLPTTNGDISALAFRTAGASFFDGTTSIDVPPDGKQFTFGTSDFTVEAWVRSSAGGEIVSFSPSASDSTHNGLRFNLNADGELRLALGSGDRQNGDAFSTGPTRAADGFWHHVAASRSAGLIILYVDGISQKLFSKQIRNGVVVSRQGVAVDRNNRPVLDSLSSGSLPGTPDLSTPDRITIGGFRDSRAPIWPQNGAKDVLWQGLLREVRVWGVAVDAATLRSRMNSILTPNLAHLRGNWHLDADLSQGGKITNGVDQHEQTATFINGRSVATDLELADSFPYLLHSEALMWPYAPRWSARGETDIASSPVLSDDGVLCFRCSTGIYGVDKLSGRRLWSIPIDFTTSGVIAYGQAFYVLIANEGLTKIDSRTGEYTAPPNFAGMPALKNDPAPLSKPAHNGQYLAAAARDGSLWVHDFSPGGRGLQKFAIGKEPGDLVLEGGKVHCVCGSPGALSLHIVDLATGPATPYLSIPPSFQPMMPESSLSPATS
jgi:outer membrane protein assembly factor BamB